MNPLREIGITLDQAAANVADGADRWVTALHEPVDLGDPGQPYCTSHWGKPVPWPCDDWTRAADRIAERRDTTRR